MIEEYPEANPNTHQIGDIPSTLNINLARNITQLALASLCTFAGIIH
jgi:hypothetical protein